MNSVAVEVTVRQIPTLTYRGDVCEGGKVSIASKSFLNRKADTTLTGQLV